MPDNQNENKNKEVGFSGNLDNKHQMEILEKQIDKSTLLNPTVAVAGAIKIVKNTHKITGILSMLLGCFILLIAWYFNLFSRFPGFVAFRPIPLLFMTFFLGGFLQIYLGSKKGWLLLIFLVMLTLAVVAGSLIYMQSIDPNSLSGSNLSVPLGFFGIVMVLLIILAIARITSNRNS